MKPVKHSIICSHGPFVDTSLHCHYISRVFSNISTSGRTNPIAAWFDIASGIEDVKYISAKYDESANWCSPSIEYEEKKSKFHSKLIFELTRFNFIWSGLEAFTQTLTINECSKKRGRGQYSDLNYFLKTEYQPNFQILKYHDELLSFLKSCIEKNDWYGKANELFIENSCISKELLGLKVIYSIRNLFAHGNFRFSEPHEYSLVKPYNIQIINASCKVVLMYIQMICIAYFKNLDDFFIDDIDGIDEEDNVQLKGFLFELHMKEAKYN